MPKYHTSIEIDDAEVDVIVEYAAVKASGDGWNEPREPAHIEIEEVRTTDGIEITLTSAQESAMEEAISESLDDAYFEEY